MKFESLQAKNEFNLTEAHLLWCLGDWFTLVDHAEKIDAVTQPEIALYIVAAQFQLGKNEQAQKLLASLELDNEKKQMAIKLLISGVYNSLGKAHACAFNHNSAKQLFKQTLHYVVSQPINESLISARTIEQHAQIGIPHLSNNIKNCEFKPDIEHFFLEGEKHFNSEPTVSIALAELCQLNEDYDKAIVHWQNVSGILDTDTPKAFYDRLKEAYKSVNGFPKGNGEQEALSGDVVKQSLLTEIHQHLQPDFYFEIGVQTGKSLALAQCEALGIDPMPMLAKELAPTTKVISTSSDSFFMKQSHLLFNKSIDLSFIDGMHLFEFALRDFINVEKYAKPHSLVIIDDIFPGHPDQAERKRRTRAWTGDVWKVKEILEEYRPDLFLLPINAYPTGLLLISALDPNSTVLSENYHTILGQYKNDIPAPSEIIQRKNAISGASEIVQKIVTILKSMRHQQNTDANLKNSLEQLVLQQSKQQVKV